MDRSVTGYQLWHVVMSGETDLGRSARGVLAALASLAGARDEVTASERALATLTGMSRTTVWTQLHVLEAQGWLAADRKPGRTTVWTLLRPAGGGS